MVRAAAEPTAGDPQSPEDRVIRNGLSVAGPLARFVDEDLLPLISTSRDQFWTGLAELIEHFSARNQHLLDTRDKFQRQIDEWFIAHPGGDHGPDHYAFLQAIGYIEPPMSASLIATSGADDEIASIAGPQLVVPLTNPRFVLQAANARWGSLFDALYGSDVIPDADQIRGNGEVDSARASMVIDFVDAFLDECLQLESGSHRDVIELDIENGQLLFRLADGTCTRLTDSTQFVGVRGVGSERCYVVRHHGLHVEFVVRRAHPVGRIHHAGISDVILESAVTTVMDCEDAVAAVDADDKVDVYRTWLRLQTGQLTATFAKNGQPHTRTLSTDRVYRTPDGSPVTLPGRGLQLVRNVGLHMRTDAVRSAHGDDVPEGIVDALITVASAVAGWTADVPNSRRRRVYVVKPKLHGSQEVAFAVELLEAVERVLGLPDRTILIGIMDEERRTSLNLANCVSAARDRVMFINTGFLDRTGDEIHTMMHAGPAIRKADIKDADWFTAYELHNVSVGLSAGFDGRAQIGKGMWAAPDEMAAMVQSKVAHPLAGASCAWVPSPTAATLHAMHYHQVDVVRRRQTLPPFTPKLSTQMTALPLLRTQLTASDIADELANNVQGILGYVVRWVDQGVGCSKVPNLHNVALMEDRATLRISTQHIANWLLHSIIDRKLVEETLHRMSHVVDSQNAGDPSYRPIGPDPKQSMAFAAACELIFTGAQAPNGYTEAALHKWRRLAKEAARPPSDLNAPPEMNST